MNNALPSRELLGGAGNPKEGLVNLVQLRIAELGASEVALDLALRPAPAMPPVVVPGMFKDLQG